MHFNNIFAMKINQIHICIKKMPGVRSIAMKSIRTTIFLNTHFIKKWERGPLSVEFLLFILLIFFNQNDVEYD